RSSGPSRSAPAASPGTSLPPASTVNSCSPTPWLISAQPFEPLAGSRPAVRKVSPTRSASCAASGEARASDSASAVATGRRKGLMSGVSVCMEALLAPGGGIGEIDDGATAEQMLGHDPLQRGLGDAAIPGAVRPDLHHRRQRAGAEAGGAGGHGAGRRIAQPQPLLEVAQMAPD